MSAFTISVDVELLEKCMLGVLMQRVFILYSSKSG